MYNQLRKRVYLIAALGMVIAIGYLFLRYGNFSHNSCTKIGLTKMSFVDPERFFDNKERQLNVIMRYPASSSEQTQKIDYGPWKVKDVALDAPVCPKDTLLPLIVFSHGYSCDAHINSWLPEYLASHGYIVASIEHYGNTYANLIVELSVRVWNRVQDVKIVLDHLLSEDSLFKDHIDKNRIGIAGFSQGGMTSLWAAGAIAHLTKDVQLKHMQTSPHILADPELRIINEKLTQADFDNANKMYCDDRIKAVFAIAPGFDFDNWLFSHEDAVRHINIPTYIIADEADDMVSIDAIRSFCENIPHCSCTIFPGKVSHWTFMNEGTELGKQEVPQFTIDDSSVNRIEIHNKVGALAVGFFDKYLRN